MNIKASSKPQPSNGYIRSIVIPDIPFEFPNLSKTQSDALKVILHHEGGYSNDPDDPGGATNFGISLRLAKRIGDLNCDGYLDLDLDHDGDVDSDDLKLLDPDMAGKIYIQQFWKDIYHSFDPVLAIKTMDLSVNMGTPQAHKELQRSIRAVSNDRLVIDGILGKRSLIAIQQVDPFALLAAYRCQTAGFYKELTYIRPRSKKYLNGWLNRAYF